MECLCRLCKISLQRVRFIEWTPENSLYRNWHVPFNASLVNVWTNVYVSTNLFTLIKPRLKPKFITNADFEKKISSQKTSSFLLHYSFLSVGYNIYLKRHCMLSLLLSFVYLHFLLNLFFKDFFSQFITWPFIDHVIKGPSEINDWSLIAVHFITCRLYWAQNVLNTHHGNSEKSETFWTNQIHSSTWQMVVNISKKVVFAAFWPPWLSYWLYTIDYLLSIRQFL